MSAKDGLEAAELGDTDAKHVIGNMYYRGEGVEINHSKAAEWHTKTSDEGYFEVQKKTKGFSLIT